MIRLSSSGGLALFVAERHKQRRTYGWKLVVHLSPNMLGLVNLNALVVAPMPNRLWPTSPNASPLGEERR